MKHERDALPGKFKLDPMRRAIVEQTQTHDRTVKIPRSGEITAYQHSYRQHGA
jgi:hypothetical protein